MSDSNYTIKIYNDINDTELKTAWVKLQHETEVFPQMFFEWIEPWVRLRFGNRKLYIITVVENGNIIGIAPFCIERKSPGFFKRPGFNLVTQLLRPSSKICRCAVQFFFLL